MQHRVEQADALEFMRSLPDSSVGLVLTDPPYFKVKPHGWDRQWSRRDGFLDWLDTVAEQWARVMKPNATLVCFAGGNPTPGATTAARVEVRLAERFNVVSSCVWVKADGWHQKARPADMRAHFPQTERALICEHFNAESAAKGEAGYGRKCDELRGFVFEPLRAYLDGERLRAGLTRRAIDAHFCSRNVSQYWWQQRGFIIPTEDRYSGLQALAPGFFVRDYEDLRREYEDLRREYEDLRREYEDLRRPFDAEAGAHFTDVWTYPTVRSYPGKHPCEKPPEMARDLVLQCSRPGDVVLDTFAGSGAFLAAAAACGRVALGCDSDPAWAAVAAAAVSSVVDGASEAPRQESLF